MRDDIPILLLCFALYPSFAHKWKTQVVGGQNAATGQFPFQALFRIQHNLTVSDCGGTLIHEKWVLTAAHCVLEESGAATPGLKSVSFGRDRSNPEVRVGVIRTYVHPGFPGIFGQAALNDIALLELSQPVTDRQPVQLGAQAQSDTILQADLPAVVVGWGDSNFAQSSVPSLSGGLSLLQWTRVELVDTQLALQIFNRESREVGLTAILRQWRDEWVPASELQGNESVCVGDSGGPLLIETVEKKYIQVGITSWGTAPCAKPYTVQVFTSVPYFSSWINRVCNNCTVLGGNRTPQLLTAVGSTTQCTDHELDEFVECLMEDKLCENGSCECVDKIQECFNRFPHCDNAQGHRLGCNFPSNRNSILSGSNRCTSRQRSVASKLCPPEYSNPSKQNCRYRSPPLWYCPSQKTCVDPYQQQCLNNCPGYGAASLNTFECLALQGTSSSSTSFNNSAAIVQDPFDAIRDIINKLTDPDDNPSSEPASGPISDEDDGPLAIVLGDEASDSVSEEDDDNSLKEPGFFLRMGIYAIIGLLAFVLFSAIIVYSKKKRNKPPTPQRDVYHYQGPQSIHEYPNPAAYNAARNYSYF